MEKLVEVLPSETVILLGFGPNTPSEYEARVDRHAFWPPVNYHFVEVLTKEPLRMRLRAGKKTRLEPCATWIPRLDKGAISLNDAYTVISEDLEPHRRAHTGNVFTVGYYKRGDGWRTLDELRKEWEVKYEDELEKTAQAPR
jgi:hypothetical protein